MGAMIVSVNGRRICRVRLTPKNSRTLIVDWTGIIGITTRLGGPDRTKNASWNMPKMKIGAEISVKFVQLAATDPPTNTATLQELWTPKARSRQRKTPKKPKSQGKKR